MDPPLLSLLFFQFTGQNKTTDSAVVGGVKWDGVPQTQAQPSPSLDITVPPASPIHLSPTYLPAYFTAGIRGLLAYTHNCLQPLTVSNLVQGRNRPRVTHPHTLPGQTQPANQPTSQSVHNLLDQRINQSIPSSPRHSPGRAVRPRAWGKGLSCVGGEEGKGEGSFLMPCDPLTETSEKLRTRNDAHDYLLCGPSPLSP